MSLEAFEKATTVDLYMAAEPPNPVVKEKLLKMVVTIDKSPSECTFMK